MKKYDVITNGDFTFRVLEIRDNRFLLIDCIKKNMPFWVEDTFITEYYPTVLSFENHILTANEKKIIRQRFSYIANILPVVSDTKKRNYEIENSSIEFHLTKQTIRKYLCLYLIYQDKQALLTSGKKEEKALTQDEKNMRWALNKFYYTSDKNTLNHAYNMMLQKKYCDSEGKLFLNYPSFYQFRYFYRKTKNLQNFYIKREGLKNYQKNHRPLLGDGVQQFANSIGTYMLDSTVCDIYLIDESNKIVGRPILTLAVDAYSSLIVGYSLSWEGGVYSLRQLMLNIIADKVELCKRNGIIISKDMWPSNSIGGKFVTDMGGEYVSETFTQLTELGVQITSLPPFRPDMKGPVEKAFDLLQNHGFKPYLKGKGVIQPDFQSRGSVDYRKQATLTLEEFEKIIIHCIVFYNSERVLENFPYSEELLNQNIKPFANEIWNYCYSDVQNNLLDVTKEELVLTLLPRTIGKFSKYGLKVNGMRYHNDNYIQKYLEGKSVTVAYNPDDSNYVWIIECGDFISFELIETRFKNKTIDEIQTLKNRQNNLIKEYSKGKTQAEIDLATHIQTIANQRLNFDKSIKNIRDNRKAEQQKKHIDFVKEVNLHE